MARIRTIKPEFWTSEQVAECSPTARLLFIGLWNFCDDAGRHPASTKRLKMEVFPGDACTNDDVAKWIEELINVGLVIEYDAEGQSYWEVTGWKHQKIDRPTIKYPAPIDGNILRPITETSPNTRRTIDNSSPPEGKGMESNGMEGSGRERRSPQPRKKTHKKSQSQPNAPWDFCEEIFSDLTRCESLFERFLESATPEELKESDRRDFLQLCAHTRRRIQLKELKNPIGWFRSALTKREFHRPTGDDIDTVAEYQREKKRSKYPANNGTTEPASIGAVMARQTG